MPRRVRESRARADRFSMRADMSFSPGRSESYPLHVLLSEFRNAPLGVKAALWVLFPDVLTIMMVLASKRSARQKVAFSLAIIATSISVEIRVRAAVRRWLEAEKAMTPVARSGGPE